jgi:hypothetical protein
MSEFKRQCTDDEHAPILTSDTPSSARITQLRFSAELAIKLGVRYCSEEDLATLFLSQKLCFRADKVDDSNDQIHDIPRFRLSTELANMLGARYCSEEDLAKMLLSQKMCSKADTFQIKATQVGDLNTWTTITLDDGHASTADVKEGMEQEKGIRAAMQELFRYDESWTGTKASGGNGHSEEQEDAALLAEGFVFEGPCSVLVSVNEFYDVVLEGQEAGEVQHDLMGVYARQEDKIVNGKGVWQRLSGDDKFLSYRGSAESGSWYVGIREEMEAPDAPRHHAMVVTSTADTPDQIDEIWQVCNEENNWDPEPAPKLRVRVCSSVEKHTDMQRIEQEQVHALGQAQQRRRLVVEGLDEDEENLMGLLGAYELMEGKTANRRAVWQLQGRDGEAERFLYFSGDTWTISVREQMEIGSANNGLIFKYSSALLPDHHAESELWHSSVSIKLPEVRVRHLVNEDGS